ncbi:hypothetical protein [Flavobacterium caseinilyticum]|uniref:Uncharacterized protein n=1 Tax=Flavobacterium caseinilyticum TaxID=2541732 RepID=A0A4R5AZ34_9FLAO|nr:hypothetical protein [Flavobacterium caseinilyticum]TDD77106.1 hypothetical protein E0F89_05775 [Flavobacterium caseinilyticum]
MIRFLKITGIYLDDKKSFAFYNTVTNKLLEFDGNQVFDDLEDFDLYYTSKCGYDYDRLTGLIPLGYFSEDSNEADA